MKIPMAEGMVAVNYIKTKNMHYNFSLWRTSDKFRQGPHGFVRKDRLPSYNLFNSSWRHAGHIPEEFLW